MKGIRKFDRIKNLAGMPAGILNIAGISEGRIALAAGMIAEEQSRQIVIVTANYQKAAKLAADLPFFTELPVYLLPDEEQLFLHYDAKSHGYLEQRLTGLAALAKGERCIVVSPVSGAVKKIAPREIFLEHVLRISVGTTLDLEGVRRKLAYMGYERMNFVESKGQYRMSGGILDIYPVDGYHPYRIELFDTEVDSIRTFDVLTQRSIENQEMAVIYPAEQMVQEENLFGQGAERIASAYDAALKRLPADKKKKLSQRKDQILEFIETKTNLQFLENYVPYFYDHTEYLWDYMEPSGMVLVDDPARVTEVLEFREREAAEDFKIILERGEAVPSDYDMFSGVRDYESVYQSNRTIVLFTPFQRQIKGVDRLEASFQVAAKQPPVFNGRMDFLETELKRYAKQGYEVVIACATEERASNMAEFLDRAGLAFVISVRQGALSSGIEFPEEKVVYLSDRDIFVTAKQRRNRTGEKSGKPIKAFTDIRKGDFVVHENHGIGKFIGVEQLVVQNVKKDYLKIKYAGEDMLYVPVDQMDLIQKYVGSEGVTPKVNKLSSGEWKKTKAKAKAAIADMAKELLEISAAREIEKGHAFGPDTPWQKEFEDLFPYEETPDQLRCIEEIKSDMEKDVAMDRLLCGDVGYGKTEVAARAIFKCIADGKQAAVLVPTTILANQHYYTFKDRFEKFPFKVEMLSRFRTDAQQKSAIEGAEKGSLDVLVGTHRILSSDVKFKDLGLLVIDEEQRFGVQHKEAIKAMRKNVDVLTLSATPIPRTLHMSLIGIKNMSLIEEPPEERYPVQTYVLEQDNELMKEAIERELDRGGQVYVVYNRVRGIQKIASEIRDLVPDASICVGHGQMNEHELERIMVDFVAGEYNILIATTIIESGINIPNVNTIIILDSDRFGLSQIYQLRGRVGRSNRLSYAYLMYQKDKVLSELAEKRLRAIKEFTEFGSGFRIAMRDLEIRGAGNVLGTAQHGHMMMIGYELYCKLVEDAIRELGGEVPEPEGEEAAIELENSAYIPDAYISDELLKLQMYKKIASIKERDDVSEMIDELLDRFGDVPKEALDLIQISYIKALSEKAGIQRVHEQQKTIIYEFGEKNSLKPAHMAKLSEVYGMGILIHAGKAPFIKCRLKGKNKLEEIVEFLEYLR